MSASSSRGVAIGIGQQVHHQIDLLGTGCLGAQGRVQAPLAQLWLAQHARLVDHVFFQGLKYAGHDVYAVFKAFFA